MTDAAYGSGQTRAELDDAGHTTVIKPMTNTTAGASEPQSGRCCGNGVGITR